MYSLCVCFDRLMVFQIRCLLPMWSLSQIWRWPHTVCLPLAVRSYSISLLYISPYNPCKKVPPFFLTTTTTTVWGMSKSAVLSCFSFYLRIHYLYVCLFWYLPTILTHSLTKPPPSCIYIQKVSNEWISSMGFHRHSCRSHWMDE